MRSSDVRNFWPLPGNKGPNIVPRGTALKIGFSSDNTQTNIYYLFPLEHVVC